MGPPDAATVYWIAGLMSTAIAGMAAWAWNHTHRRIDSLITELNQKATVDELNRQRHHVETIYEKIGTINTSIAKVESQIDRFIAHLESERTTRATQNLRVEKTLEKIRDRLGTRDDDRHPK